MATAEQRNPKSNSEEEEEKDKKGKEGGDLLGPPTFKELDNGRFKCIETGHEMPAKDMKSYCQSKRCRSGLINSALSHKKPPLNMFKQDPLSRSKLVCKLTGDTINKSEEHIWKHINGKRFLNKLEQKEAGKVIPIGKVLEKEGEEMPPKALKPRADGMKTNKKKKKKKQDKGVDEIISNERKSFDKDCDSEEADFWMPPVGSRWDFDNGGDRWGSGSESGQETDDRTDGADEENGNECFPSSDSADEENGNESGELSMRTKRMSIEVGPSSFASRKKKSKTDSTCYNLCSI